MNSTEFITEAGSATISCIAETPFGCVDATACNYEVGANTDDGSCEYPAENYDCDDVCINDSDSDTVCDEYEVMGCQDVNACNYNILATDSDDSCELPLEFYNCANECLLDADEDNVCDELEVEGCQDETACNYNSLATDAGDCTYEVAFYNCENECLLDSDSDGVCDELEVEGCQDEIACNYNELATDASDCEYATENYDCDEVCLNDVDSDGVCDELEVVGCQDETACDFNELATDSDDCTYVDGVCESCVDGLIVDNDSDDDTVCDANEILACTDENACNYDATLTTDTDNSLCVYSEGCQECSGEIDGSGIVLDIDPSICAFTLEETIAIIYDDVSIQNSEADSLLFVSNIIALIETQLEIPEGTVEIIEIIITEVRAYNVEVVYEVVLNQQHLSDLNVNIDQLNQSLSEDISELADIAGNSGNALDFVEGCTSENANNFNELANINDGSCEFTEPGCGVQGACNYNPELDVQYSDDDLCVFIELYHFCADSLIGDSTVYYDGGCYYDVNLDGICDDIQVSGCTDELAFNYNELAAIEDGSCIETVEGCTDEIACNYEDLANTNNGTCVYPANYYNCSQECLLDTDNDQVCDELEIEGCTDPLASNFNSEATEDDATCEIDEGCGDVAYLEYSFTAKVHNNNLCITLIVEGCMDENACNYDALANTALILQGPTGEYIGTNCEYPEDNKNCNEDCISDIDFDGVCDEDEIIGCQDSSACNYNEFATDFGDCDFAVEFFDCEQNCLNDLNLNGVCDELEIEGCIDQSACNYNELATITDTLYCEYPMDSYLNCEGDCNSDIDQDGICDDLEVDGCLDELAINYNQYATNSIDNLCEFTSGCKDPSMYNYDESAVLTENTTCIPFISGCTDTLYTEYSVLANLEDGTCTNLAITGCTDPLAVNENINANIEDYSCEYAVEVGCMDANYLNFSPTAVVNNPTDCGALIVHGCTNPEYLEYNPNATVEDGTCLQFPFEGCTDETYLEYNPFYNTPLEGACTTLHVVGCMNSHAYNYNSEATIYIEEEESCILFGCMDDSYAEYYTQGFEATNNLPSACSQSVVFGCTNPVATVTSYNPSANVNQISAEITESPCVYNTGNIINFVAENTGTDMSVLIPYEVLLSGDFTQAEQIPAGSLIGVFYTNNNQLICGGFDEWNSEEDLANNIPGIGIEVYGDDELTSDVDGFVIGETMQWMLLSPDGLLYTISPVYNTDASSGSGTGNSFSPDGFSAMIHMDVQFSYQMPVVGCRNSKFLDYNPDAFVDGVGGFDNGEPFIDLINNATLVQIPDGLDDDNMYDLNDDGQANPGCFVLSSYGCMNPLAFNFNVVATIPDDSCIPVIEGCQDPLAFNYILPLGNENVDVNVDNPSMCIPEIKGCLSDVYAYNFTAPIGDPFVDVNTAEDCIPVIEGCTDPLAFNYNYIISEGLIVVATGNPYTTANTEVSPSVCVPRVYGCTDENAFNYDELANTSSVYIQTGATTCYPVIEGCTDPTALNYQAAVGNEYIDINTPVQESCLYTIAGCTDPTALNYNNLANSENNSCIAIVHGCMESNQTNYNPLANTSFEGACIPFIYGCLNNEAAFNYTAPTGNPYIDVNTQSECIAVVEGCTDVNAHENSYSFLANTDDGSCFYAPGCTDDNFLAYWDQGYMADFDDGSCGILFVEFYCADEWYLEYYENPVFGSETAAGNYPHISACHNQLITYCNDNLSISYYPTFDVADGTSQQLLGGNFASTDLEHCSETQISAYCNNPDYIEYYGINLSVHGDNAKEDGGNIIDNATCATPVDFYCDDTNSLAYYDFDSAQNDYNIALTDTGNVLDSDLCGVALLPYCNNPLNTAYYISENSTDGLASSIGNIIDDSMCDGELVVFYCTDDTKIGYYDLEENFLSGAQNQLVGTIINNELTCGDILMPHCNDVAYTEHYTDLATLNPVDPSLWNIVDYSLCETPVVFGCMDNTMYNYSDTANVDGFDYEDLNSICFPIIEGCTNTEAYNYNDYDFDGFSNEFNQVEPTVNINTHNQDLCVPIIEGCLSDQFAFNYPVFTGNPLVDINTDNIDSCIAVVSGCMDITAFNYLDTANTPDPDSCEPFVYGCMDTDAFNYDAEANSPDECIPVIFGCTIPGSLNVNYEANTDNDLCVNPVFGCIDNGTPFLDVVINATGELGTDGVDDDYQYDVNNDSLPAFNYYENATIELNCIAQLAGCINPIAYNFNPQANVSNGSCIPVINGCTDPLAYNFNSEANTEFSPSNCEDDVQGCLDQNALNYNCTDGTFPLCYPNCNIDDDLYCEDSGVNVHNQSICETISLGCTDYTSINFIPAQNANVDNNSCVPIVFGCTDPTALNYDANANANNYSCLVSIEGCIDNGQAFLDELNNSTGELIPDGLDDDYQYDLDGDSLPALNYSTSANHYEYTGPDYEYTCVPKIYGCTNELAINFYIDATISDLACISSVSGCIDNGEIIVDLVNNITGEEIPDGVDDDYQYDVDGDGISALNYNPYANTNDGSCITSTYGCMVSNAFNYNPNATISDGSCVASIEGCTNANSLNFNPIANIDNGSCIEMIFGCLNAFSINFNPNATVADGSCIAIVNGCTDQTALNYNSSANVDDGSCVIVVYGCMNELASNYNSNATVADGSCYIDVVGCIDELALNYNPIATLDNGSCVLAIYGCMNELASNFNANANVADGSCIAIITGCTDPEALNYNAFANTENDSCVEKIEGCNIPSMFNYNTEANFNDGTCIPVVNGCTDLNAFNYSSNANTEFDPSDCENIIEGCMLDLPFICNFNPNANVDDNSCESTSCLRRGTSRAFANPVCVDPIAENYFALLDSITPSSEWATSYFNPEAENFQAAWVNQFYIDASICDYIEGCTDINMLGYNPNATLDDGSCVPYVYGCMDIEYVEYNETVNTSDNSCNTYKVFGCDDVNAFNYDNSVTVYGLDQNNDFIADTDGEDVLNPCEDFIYGCTDNSFVEYWDSYDLTGDSLVPVSPTPNSEYTDSEGESLSCITNMTLGCTDSEYINYWIIDDNNQIVAPNPIPNFDNGSCTESLILGCTDSEYIEFNSEANADQYISEEFPSMCIALKVEGCTNPAYINYNSLANFDNGTCETLVVEGCTDDTYIEYWEAIANDDNSQYELFSPVNIPNTDDGSCTELIVRGCNIETAENYYLDSSELTSTVNVLDNTICVGIVGCMNINASNYNELAVAEGDCAGCTDANAVNWNDWADIDDGSCEVYGCTEPTAANYDSTATIDDSSCLAVILEGCTDPLAFNYCVECNTEDNSCIPVVLGCTDSLYVEYYDWSYDVDTNYQIVDFSIAPNTEDNSCDHIMELGCTLFEYLEFTESATVYNSEACITPKVFGCLDPLYLESQEGDFNATIYDTIPATQFHIDNGMADELGEDVIADLFCFTFQIDGCMDANYLEYDDSATNDNGTCTTLKVLGCTEENSINYNAAANVEDGSCIPMVLGCTDQFAFNYDPLANTNDASCIAIIYGCPDPNYLEHYNYNLATFSLDTIPDSLAYNTDAYSGDSYCLTEIIEGCADDEYIEYYDYDATTYSITYKVNIPNVNNNTCSTPLVYGCVDADYLEYTASTNVHQEGVCTIPKVSGCMDADYVEYWDYDSINYVLNSPLEIVNFDDGSCVSLVVLGCLNELADNYTTYQGIANVHDVTYCEGGFGCLLPQYVEHNASYIAHNPEECTTLKVFGCTDVLAYNFDVLANTNGVDTYLGGDFFGDLDSLDNTIDPCYPVIEGCTDSTAFNFTTLLEDVNLDVNTDDGSCYPVILGCTDSTAFNFLPLIQDPHQDVNTDDNSCYSVKEGCLDLDAYNYNDWSGDGVADIFVSAISQNINTHVEALCISKVFGCMDESKFNYDYTANTQETNLNDSTDPCIDFAYGCTNNSMFNFDELANTSQVSISNTDSPCYPFIYGCTDIVADNYIQLIGDSLIDVNFDDGTCEYFGCTNYTALNFDEAANVNDGSCIISGCTIDLYSNYNPAATHDDGSCSYSIVEVYGCMNPNYIEYYNYDNITLTTSLPEELVTIDNGTCQNLIISGCSINTMFNYEASVNVADNDVCIPVVEGCTDSAYIEYWNHDTVSMTISEFEFIPNTENGTCENLIVEGCTIENNSQYDILANVYDTLACLVEGCTDEAYLEFDLSVTLANMDSCITPVIEGCTDEAFIEYYNIESYNAETETYLLSVKEFIANTDNGSCDNLIVTGCYYQDFVNYNAEVNVYNFYDVPNTYELGITILDLCGDALITGCTDHTAYNYDPTANVEGLCIYAGCTLPFAFNYNEYADIDDGSCIPIIEGCTVSSFLNYNPEANIDDGSCSNSPVIYGCTDSLYFEYNILATHSAIPTTCITLHIVGCMDVNAVTWNPLATIHDNSLCTDEVISGCTSEFYLEFNPLASVSVPSSCITPVVEGCTVENSTNFNPTANYDDGSCIEIVYGCTDSNYLEYWDYDAIEKSILPLNTVANTELEVSTCTTLIASGCTDTTFVESHYYTQVAGYFYLNGLNETINISQNSSCINPIVKGCIYDTFIEFNPGANVFDIDACLYIVDEVCIDPLADNYQESTLINSTYTDGSLSYIYQENNTLCNYTGCMNDAFIEYQEYYTISDDDNCETYKVVGCSNENYIESYVDNSLDSETGLYILGELNTYVNFEDPSLCITPIIEGCTIWYYSEYNPSVNIADNSLCVQVAQYGCSDPLADNFDEEANFVEDGTLNYNEEHCVYYGCTDENYIEYWDYNSSTQQISTPLNSPTDSDGSCAIAIVFGCTNIDMFNYSSSANVNQVSLEDNTSPCEGKIFGCTDEAYIEFNPLANIENGLCSELVVYGCTNSFSINYNPLANTNDGSCIAKVQGCADNGQPFLDVLNNLTGLVGADGVDDDYQYDYDQDGVAAFNYNSDANISVLCVAVTMGCIDSEMFNYNPLANTNDDTCVPVIEGCLNLDYYNYNDYDYDGAPNVLTGDPFIDINTNNTAYCEQQQLGCIDNQGIEIDGTPIADNLDPNANTDNGSCIYYGCMDEQADNYESWATHVGNINNCLYYGCTLEDSFNYDEQANFNDGSCIQKVEGCVNDSFIEYWDFDALSNTISLPQDIPNVNNGSCLTLIVFGCTNASATNYVASALVNQVSFEDESSPCIPYVFGCTDSTMFNYNSLANTDNGSCVEFIEGCMNPLATNYNANANINEDCILPIYGCTDLEAFNYSPDAEEDDGSCIEVVQGCVNPFAINYNPEANTNDGSCLAFVSGCTDSTALNYSSYATFDNGSCVEIIPGCTNVYAVNYDENANQYLEGSCSYEIEEIEGCIFEFASNYDPLATIDDGSCEFELLVNRVMLTVCIDPTAIGDSYFQYADPNSETYVGAENVIAYGWIVDNSTCIYDVFGCTNDQAINYNPEATSDDGSCILNAIYGCMDSNYLEYDSEATLDTDPSSCVNEIIEGCDEPSASNYNPLVNVSDNATCVYDLIAGCTDSDYIEYWLIDQSTQTLSLPANIANDDDGSCSTVINFGCTKADAYNYDSEANINQISAQNQNSSCIDVVFGCTDIAMFNYNELANTEDGSCVEYVYGCTNENYLEFDILANTDTDPSSCSTLHLFGCTDPLAFNYNEDATLDDSSCIAIVTGCTNPEAINFNEEANEDDGSCNFENLGCTDVNSENYDANANTDDGTCMGCTIDYAVNFCTTCPLTDNTNCSIEGCTDSNVINYDPAATIDDGTCNPFANQVYGCTDDQYLEYYTHSGSSIYVLEGPATFMGALINTDNGTCATLILTDCTNSDACNYNISANVDAGNCAVPVNCDSCTGEQDGSGGIVDNDQDNDGLCDAQDTVADCTDVNACNYNASATVNTDNTLCTYVDGICDTCEDGNVVANDIDADGVCDLDEVVGCQDATACNYNASATDASDCIYADAICAVCENGESVVYDIDNDGLCDAEDTVFACTDALACNYNASETVNTDNSLCTYVDGVCETCVDGLVVDNDTDNDGLCDTEDVQVACTDVSACNYNSSTTVNTDNSLCTYVDGVCDTCEDGVVIPNDIDNDGVCDQDEIVGCEDPLACNYNENATDAGACNFANAICSTCENGEAVIYDIDNDGLCDAQDTVSDCTDVDACNYNASETVNTDNSLCTYVDGICETCVDGLVVDNDTDNDGLCDAEDTISECTDITACNYNASETVNTDNSLCTYVDGICDTCEEGVVIGNDIDGDGVCDAYEVIGCQDPLADNYSPLATEAGDCIYYGCTSPEACNFSSIANTNNGSCVFANTACSVCEDEMVIIYDIDNDGLCDAEDTISACTDMDACNYNNSSTVNTDNTICMYTHDPCDTCTGELDGTGTVMTNDQDNDGLCDSEDQISGCTDIDACNYNNSSTVNEDNSICVYAIGDCDVCVGGQDGTGVLIDNDADNDGVCDLDEFVSCTDETACNYNANLTADTDNTLCIYSADLNDCASCSGEQDGTGTIVDNDADIDGVCDADEIVGCCSPWADNWVPLATDCDDSCIKEGCMVEGMFNYDSLATYDMGNCVLVVYGCLDVVADNYSELANTQGGQCNYSGCMDSLYQNYDPIANIAAECIFYGCTIEGMLNYQEIATHNDGSCIEIVEGCMEFGADNYNELANSPTECYYTGCMDSEADNYNPLANVPAECIFYGCMNSSACNYDALANTQLNSSCAFPDQYYNCDGTCIIDTDNDGVCNQFEVFGCTDEDAVNYDPFATQDDGSCYEALVVENLTVFDAACKGGTGSVQLTISGGLEPITVVSYTTYQTNQTMQVNNGVVTISNVHANIESGIQIYNIHVFDANGVGEWYPYTIEQPEEQFEMSLEYDELDQELSFDASSMNTNYVWSYNGTPIPGANNPVLSPFENGMYGLELTDEFGCSLEQEIDITGLSLLDEQDKWLSVYPNPANDIITISSSLLLDANAEIKLFDLLGNLVLNLKVEESQLEDQVLDVSNLSEGTYLVSIFNGYKNVYTKVVIH